MCWLIGLFKATSQATLVIVIHIKEGNVLLYPRGAEKPEVSGGSHWYVFKGCSCLMRLHVRDRMETYLEIVS